MDVKHHEINKKANRNWTFPSGKSCVVLASGTKKLTLHFVLFFGVEIQARSVPLAPKQQLTHTLQKRRRVRSTVTSSLPALTVKRQWPAPFQHWQSTFPLRSLNGQYNRKALSSNTVTLEEEEEEEEERRRRRKDLPLDQPCWLQNTSVVNLETIPGDDATDNVSGALIVFCKQFCLLPPNTPSSYTGLKIIWLLNYLATHTRSRTTNWVVDAARVKSQPMPDLNRL